MQIIDNKKEQFTQAEMISAMGAARAHAERSFLGTLLTSLSSALDGAHDLALAARDLASGDPEYLHLCKIQTEIAEIAAYIESIRP